MSMALAHALELPGKMRLDKETYIAVQAIYYPGFTIGGFAEPLSIVGTFFLLLMTRHNHPAFSLTLVALVALAAMHSIFWIVTQPVNRFWLQKQQLIHLTRLGAKFFSTNATEGAEIETSREWKKMRDRWEYSHLVRAVLSVIALVTLAMAIAICP
jgi:hypothetical protein